MLVSHCPIPSTILYMNVHIYKYHGPVQTVSLLSIPETREGWPLLTVKTEVNGDSKRTNERGPFLVGSLGFSY